MAEVVDGEGYLVPDFGPHIGYVLAEPVDAAIGDLNACEGVHNVAPGPHAGRGDHRVVDPIQQADTHVHLEKAEAGLHPLPQAPPHHLAVRFARRIAVAEDAIAELASRQLIGRHTVGLTGQIHQRHLHGAHAAPLPAVMAELHDPPEQTIHVTRVLAQQPALQQKRETRTGTVAHLPEAIDTLVRVQPQEDRIERHAGNARHPHVGDPQL